MSAHAVRAVCREDGLIQLLDSIELPRNKPFTLVLDVREAPRAAAPRSLRGRFPELAGVPGDAFEDAKHAWERGAARGFDPGR
jgi:hypothetical protein